MNSSEEGFNRFDREFVRENEGVEFRYRVSGAIGQFSVSLDGERPPYGHATAICRDCKVEVTNLDSDYSARPESAEYVVLAVGGIEIWSANFLNNTDDGDTLREDETYLGEPELKPGESATQTVDALMKSASETTSKSEIEDLVKDLNGEKIKYQLGLAFLPDCIGFTGSFTVDDPGLVDSYYDSWTGELVTVDDRLECKQLMG